MRTTKVILCFLAFASIVAGCNFGRPAASASQIALDDKLTAATKTNNAPEVRQLLKQGADPNDKSIDLGFSFALSIAIAKNETEIFNMLIQAGAWTTPTDLMQASNMGHIGMVAVLLKRHVPINGRDDQGNTAVMWACHHNRLAIVKLLVANCADVTLKNNKGADAQSVAKSRGYVELARYLANVTSGQK